MGKWTDAGFVANNLQSYKDSLVAIFKNAYGDDFDVSDASPQGILIQGIAEMLYNTDMDGIQAYSMFNLNSVSGSFLDAIGSQRGIPRRLGTKQTAAVAITCNPSNFIAFTIPAGTQFSTLGDEAVFVTTTIETINTPSSSITLEYEDSGDSAAIVGSKLQVEGFGQITDITITALTPGQEVESDASYRRRLQREYPAANNTIEWVSSKLLEQPLVRDVSANYNDTAAAAGGIAPYCTEFMVVPVGGTVTDAFKQQVGVTIINNKVPGSPTDGNTSVTVTDMFGTQKTVKFTVPTQKQLMINVTVSTPEETGFLDLANVDEIREDIFNYINNLRLGTDVSYSRCAAPLFADKGFDVQVFKIKAVTDTDWVENSNYTIGQREYAAITMDNIVIGV